MRNNLLSFWTVFFTACFVYVQASAQNTSPYWSLAGNSNASATTSKLGTTNAIPLRLFTNNAVRMYIHPTSGNVGIGTTTPLTKFHVNGTGAFGNQVTAANATRALNLADNNAVMRVLRVHASFAPAVELISRTSADGANVAYWDFYAEPSDKSFRIRDRVGGGSGLDRLTISSSGNVGIGTTAPQYKLSINGTTQAKEVRVETGWADYVFEKDYKLLSLEELAKYIEQNKHLPGIASAKEIQKNGLALGEMQAKMMEKIEELTLYIIELQKQINELKRLQK